MGYHYTESGLDYVYLENGYTIHDTPYGKGVSIQDSEHLHKMLGDWVVDLPCPLNGAELRFLRIEMDMSQRALAGILGTTEQAVRRWEKSRSKEIPGSSDRLLRALYKEYAHGKSSVRQIVDRMAALDVIDTKPVVRFRETKKGWQPKVALAHRFTDAVRQEPRGFDGEAKGARQLVRADALLRTGDQIDRL